MIKEFLSLTLLIACYPALAQTPCKNGAVNGFPCEGIDLYAHLDNETLSGTNSIEGSDIWGWTDTVSGKEYALMCQTNGTVFVDLSNPSAPEIIGRLPSHQNKSSLWRDIKVYKDFAFVVADNNSGHGMQVFDLKRLRAVTSPPEVFTADARYTGVSSAHNIVINPEESLAYIVGARGAGNDCGAGGLHIVDISNPLTPSFAGCFDSDGYTHDAQVVTYHGPDLDYQGMQIAFNANENTITIANVNKPQNTSLISKQGYTASAYTHQGWLTEDHRYFISNDELDELRGSVNNTRTIIWDVTDLDNPILLSEYYSSRNTIDHNLYTHQGIVYQSNYTNGLVLLDAAEVSNGNLTEVGYFDTYPADNNTTFHGTWSNFPYFKSGLIIVSDIDNGLFILKRSKDSEAVLTQQPVIFYGSNSATVEIITAENITIDSFQWEVATDNNQYILLEDNEIYAGTNSARLKIDFSAMGEDEQRYRCQLTTSNSINTYSALSNPVKRLNGVAVATKQIEPISFLVYPNPAKDKIIIENTGKYAFKTFTIYSPEGKIKLAGGINTETIDISSIAAGIYLLILQDENQQTYYKKIIIQ